jgi:hypothetical protein
MATVKSPLRNYALKAPEARVAGPRGGRISGGKAVSARDSLRDSVLNGLISAGTGMDLSVRVPVGKRVMRVVAVRRLRAVEVSARLPARVKIRSVVAVRNLSKTSKLAPCLKPLPAVDGWSH